MIRTNPARFRQGFTLIEMLVVMALIAGLAAIAMIVAPGAMNKDRAATAVAQIQGALQISRARAIRDGLPRGVRFVYDPTKLNPNLVTEYQYIEVAPMFVPNPGGSLGVLPYAPTSPPYVQFNYTLNSGNVTSRTCTINALDGSHIAPVAAATSLYLPTLGTLHIVDVSKTTVAGTTVTLTLYTYPDEQLGAETQWRTYDFGLNGGIRTLLGEPTIQLPYASCVDLNLSSPGGGKDCDILFTSSGLIDSNSSTNGAGQIFLWVRDPNKPQPTFGNSTTYTSAGEMLAVSIKAKSGGIGAAPVDWGADPFFLAKKALSGQ